MGIVWHGRGLGTHTAGRTAPPISVRAMIISVRVDAHQITSILHRLRAGEHEAWHDLAPLVYNEIKRQASRQVRAESGDPLLQTTMLVHEVFLRLVAEPERDFQNRYHFHRVCALVIRRILVDSARRRKSQRRGGARRNISLDSSIAIASPAHDAEALDAALTRLAEIHPRPARVVELRYFVGLSLEEIATSLGVTTKTVQRDWTAARAWLRAELSAEP